MKRTLLAFLVLTSFLAEARSQVTIGVEEFRPTIGDRYILHTIDYVNPGKEVIWDLSEVVIRSSNAVQIIDPAESPFADDFTNTDLCYDLGNGEYLYYKLEGNAYSAAGGFTQGEILVNTDPKDLIRFPIETGDTYKDSYSSSFQLQGIQFDRQGEIEWRMIGEGTAIFPFGIMDDVIKVRVDERIEDRYLVMGEPAVVRSTKESYYFMKAGVNEFIMSLHIVKQDGIEESRYGTLLDTGELSSMLAMNAPLRAVHHKMDANNASLDLKLISEWTGELHVSLTDIKGKDAIDTQILNVIPGDVSTVIDLSEVQKGTYIMTLEMDDRLSQLKVVKE